MKKEPKTVSAAAVKAYRAKKMLAGSALGTGMSAVFAPTSVLASAAGTSSSGTADASSMTKGIIGIILALAKYLGIFLLAWGVVQVIASFINDNPQGRMQGVQIALVGIALIVIRTVLHTIPTLDNYIPSSDAF